LFNTDGAANPARPRDRERFHPGHAVFGWIGLVRSVGLLWRTNSTGNNVTISNNDFQDSTVGDHPANAVRFLRRCSSTTTVPSGASQVYFPTLDVTGKHLEFAGSTGSNYESNSIVASAPQRSITTTR